MVNAFSFSYTPKPSTALAAITPLKLLGEGRESLRFTASTPMSFIKQNPEVVTEGFWKGRQALTEGIVKGTTSALSGVTGALAAKAAETKADTDANTAHTRAVAIARIKAEPTAAETAYQQQRTDLLTQQITSAKEKIKESTEGIDSTAVDPGELDFSRFLNFKDPVQELPPPTETPVTAPAPASVAPPVAPAVTQVAPKSVFGQSTNGLVPLREALKKTEAISEAAPVPVPSPAPVLSEVTLPESAGSMTLNGDILELMPVSGAEGTTPAKPLEGTTPPPVEPPLPVDQTAVPTQPTELTKEQYDEVRYQIESELTGRPFKSLADARRATQVLEQTLGVKAQITTEKGEKGSRLHYVEIVDEAPPAKTAPEGFITESIKDADGKETYVYKPKVPIESQVRSIDNGIKTAKILKQQIADIKSLSGGLIPGIGGVSSLMAKLPYPTDASTVRAINEGIKGLIGFKELVDLKAAGGSLGALSDSELKMLTSLQGSLDIDNLHAGNYLTNLKRIEESVTALEGGLENQKQKLMRVENKTNFQHIQSEKPKYKKGVSSFQKDGYTYVWDGTEFKLSK